METSQPQISYTPFGSQKSSDVTLDRLPLEIRLRIYDKLLPKAIIFRVTQSGKHSQWPKNPMANLAACFPQFKNEINFRMYSSIRFIFYDSLQKQDRNVKTYGYEIATKFFSYIGPTNLSYIREIYCHFHWDQPDANLPHLFDMLSLMAATDPPRHIRKLDLSFTRTSRVRPYTHGPIIRRQSVELHGFPGAKIILIFPDVTDRLSVPDLNRRIAEFRDRGPQVNFLTVLPAELRNEIFRYFVPSVRSCTPYRQINNSENTGWLYVNRQMTAEICSLMYGECRFKICIPSSLRYHRYSNHNRALGFSMFLKKIGRRNASQIQSITIEIRIERCIWDPLAKMGTPVIVSILRVINNGSAFQIDTRSIPAPLGFEGLSRQDSVYLFRIPSRVGTTLSLKLDLLHPQHFHSSDTLKRSAISILKTSLARL